MSPRARPPRALAAALVAALLPLAAACGGDGTGPDLSDSSVQVTLRKSEPTVGPIADRSPSFSHEETDALVTLASIESLSLTLDGVEVFRLSSDGSGGSWVPLGAAGAQQVFVLALPGEGDGDLVASADLDPGDYRDVRLSVPDAAVTFSQDATVPGGEGSSSQDVQAGSTHDLIIPNGADPGLELSAASFSIPGETGTTVRVIIDVPESISAMVSSDQGLVMSPVLSAETTATDTASGG